MRELKRIKNILKQHKEELEKRFKVKEKGTQTTNWEIYFKRGCIYMIKRDYPEYKGYVADVPELPYSFSRKKLMEV